jgi:Alpha/beta hydrolase family
MNRVTSKDGTPIAYDRQGSGPAVILVGGAFVDRSENAPLATELAQRFTVYNYDRRGRGQSGDTQPYALDREIEDLQALIAEAGGSAHLYGVSSGGALVLEAVAAGVAADRLAVYEVPYNMADDGPQRQREYAETLEGLLAEGRRGDAAELFMRVAGASEEIIAGARSSPVRPWPTRWPMTRRAWATASHPPTGWPGSPGRPWSLRAGRARSRSWAEAATSSTGPPTPSPPASPVPGGRRSPARPTWSTPRRWHRCSRGSSEHDLATAH